MVISIHAPHEGVRHWRRSVEGRKNISIHAPHEGVRPEHPGYLVLYHISIHAPHEGVRLAKVITDNVGNIFQSTHPTRGCDGEQQRFARQLRFQSTHPTRGCDVIRRRSNGRQKISIHAPHEGVRRDKDALFMPVSHFNPRTPRGGATPTALFIIGIICDFNPRTPRGGATLSQE